VRNPLPNISKAKSKPLLDHLSKLEHAIAAGLFGADSGPTGYIDALREIDQFAGEVVDFPIGKIISIEPTLDDKHVSALVKGSTDKSSSEFPKVYLFKNRHYSLDGNHRLAAEHIKGNKSTNVLLLDVNRIEKFAKSLNEEIADIRKRAGITERTAYHGTEHDFERFDINKIGSGEGNTTYGWGLYFSEEPGVAGAYRDALSQDEHYYLVDGQRINIDQLEGIQKFAFIGLSYGQTPQQVLDNAEDNRVSDENLELLAQALKQFQGKKVERVVNKGGSLMTVEIADPVISSLLNWDANLSQQPPNVQKAFEQMRSLEVDSLPAWKTLVKRYGEKPEKIEQFHTSLSNRLEETLKLLDQDIKGSDLYDKVITPLSGSQRDASLFLLSLGVPGIQYMDQFSRQGTSDKITRNYVLFDDSSVTIKAKEEIGEDIKEIRRLAGLDK